MQYHEESKELCSRTKDFTSCEGVVVSRSDVSLPESVPREDVVRSSSSLDPPGLCSPFPSSKCLKAAASGSLEELVVPLVPAVLPVSG